MTAYQPANLNLKTMTKIFTIEDALDAVKDALQNKVADYLDVNRLHIRITLLATEVIGEDMIDWDADEYDAMEGQEFETYYRFAYQYRENSKTLDWGEENYMVWIHTRGVRDLDRVMTEEEFERFIEDKKGDITSTFYEG